MSNEKITMTHPIDEQLSAFVDDELDPRELPMFTAQVARSPGLRRRLARYALIGDCLRGDLRLEPSALAIADRVRAALDAEPEAPPLPAPRAAGGWHRPALGVAAGVAIAAALLLNLPTAPMPQQAPVTAATAPAAALPVAASLPATPPPRASLPAASAAQRPARADVRMTNYLVYHGEYAGMLSSRAVASRIVDQDSGNRWVRQAVLTDD